MSGPEVLALLKRLGLAAPEPAPHEGNGTALEPSLTNSAGAAPSPLRRVDFSQKGITAAEARLLAPTLRTAMSVEVLKLCYNQLRDDGAAAVASAVDRHLSLQTLDLGFNDIGDKGAAGLARSLAGNCTLRTLYLSGNSIGPVGARALADALKHSRQGQGLTCLHLTGNSIGPEGAKALAEALHTNASLEKLYLGGSGVEVPGACALAEALSVNSSLRCLHLSDNQIGDQGVFALAQALQQNRRLVLLELSFNRVTAAGVESLVNSLSEYAALKTLQLDNNQIGNRGVQQVADALQSLSLEHLDVGFNAVGPPGVKALMHALLRRGGGGLNSLTLSGNPLEAEGAKAIALAVAQPLCPLEALSVDHTNIGRAGERHIAAGLLSNQRLRLRQFTGYRLSAAFTELGMPAQVEGMTNEQALDHIRASWSAHLAAQQAALATAAAAAAAAAAASPNRQTAVEMPGAATNGPGNAANGSVARRAAADGMVWGVSGILMADEANPSAAEAPLSNGAPSGAAAAAAAAPPPDVRLPATPAASAAMVAPVPLNNFGRNAPVGISTDRMDVSRSPPGPASPQEAARLQQQQLQLQHFHQLQAQQQQQQAWILANSAAAAAAAASAYSGQQPQQNAALSPRGAHYLAPLVPNATEASAGGSGGYPLLAMGAGQQAQAFPKQNGGSSSANAAGALTPVSLSSAVAAIDGPAFSLGISVPNNSASDNRSPSPSPNGRRRQRRPQPPASSRVAAAGQAEFNHGNAQAPVAASRGLAVPHWLGAAVAAAGGGGGSGVSSGSGGGPGAAAAEAVVARHVVALREIAKMPFDAAELWRLHQYYFSPPPNPQLLVDSAGQGHGDDPRDYHPPAKRPANSLTKTRIAYLPRLKARVESMKGPADEGRVLTLLRQLRYLETARDHAAMAAAAAAAAAAGGQQALAAAADAAAAAQGRGQVPQPMLMPTMNGNGGSSANYGAAAAASISPEHLQVQQLQQQLGAVASDGTRAVGCSAGAVAGGSGGGGGGGGGGAAHLPADIAVLFGGGGGSINGSGLLGLGADIETLLLDVT